VHSRIFSKASPLVIMLIKYYSVYFKKAKHFFERRIAVIGEPIILSDYCDKKNLSVEDINKLSDIMLEKMQICKQACIKYEE